MNLRAAVGGFVLLSALVSCSGPKGPFTEVRTWKFPDPSVAMAFYAASPDQDEAALRSAAEGFAKELLQAHRDVRVVVLYDAAHARALSSDKAMENMMKGGGASAVEFLHGGKKEGGGYLYTRKDGAPPQWVYVPLREAATRKR